MSRFSKYSLSFSSLLIVVMLILLGVLASSQYRWLGRVSTGDRELMKASLQLSARHFCEDFDSEITLAYSTFKIDGVAGFDESLSGYGERYDKWLNSSAHPQIVKGIYLVRRADDGGIDLLRFDTVARTFVSVEWPTEFEPLHSRIKHQNSEPHDPSDLRGGSDTIDEEIPALVTSVGMVKREDAANSRSAVDPARSAGYVIIDIDLDYLKSVFMPALAERYFSSGGDLDYNVSVVSRADPRKVIYQSVPEDNRIAERPADAIDRFFKISFDKSKIFSSQSINSSGQPTSGAKPLYDIVIPKHDDDKSSPAKILLVTQPVRWELRINHRGGSLDDAVNNARRLNLLTSLGILFLFGASVILVVLLSRRSQNLARRQIEFVAGVSHEFRTPLAVIHSLSENLASGRIKGAEQLKHYGITINHNSRRLTEMVEQVLEFAGAERNQQRYEKNPLDIGNLIENVLAANQKPLQKSGWSIEKEIQPDLPLILGDEAALVRAFQNLLSNAMKYAAGVPWLKIQVYRAGRRQKPEVHIVFEDKGMGMSREDIAHIFEPFYRGREAINAQIPGNGLGLNIVKQTIEAHGGTIIVESVQGQGSRFILHLPVPSL